MQRSRSANRSRPPGSPGPRASLGVRHHCVSNIECLTSAAFLPSPRSHRTTEMCVARGRRVEQDITGGVDEASSGFASELPRVGGRRVIGGQLGVPRRVVKRRSDMNHGDVRFSDTVDGHRDYSTNAIRWDQWTSVTLNSGHDRSLRFRRLRLHPGGADRNGDGSHLHRFAGCRVAAQQDQYDSAPSTCSVGRRLRVTLTSLARRDTSTPLAASAAEVCAATLHQRVGSRRSSRTPRKPVRHRLDRCGVSGPSDVCRRTRSGCGIQWFDQRRRLTDADHVPSSIAQVAAVVTCATSAANAHDLPRNSASGPATSGVPLG